MLTNPIRGKAGKQITFPISVTAGAILYVVPAGKYFEIPYIPTSVYFTYNGVQSAVSAQVNASAVLQAGTAISPASTNIFLFGTEYDA